MSRVQISSPTLLSIFQMKIRVYIISLILLTGCASVQKTVDTYSGIYEQIRLGDSKEKVLSLLKPAQSSLGVAQQKPQERFSRDGHIYDIYYARSAWIPDGETTDDEFTPYIFKDNVLIEIGWDYLGGPERTSAEIAREQAEIEKARASAARIETKIEQTTQYNQD